MSWKYTIPSTVPQAVLKLAKKSTRHRRPAARYLPWSLMNEAQRALALATITRGRAAIENRK